MSALLSDLRAVDTGPHPLLVPQARAARAPQLETVWARHDDDVRAAQRLRFQVFVQEMGAKIDVPPGTPPGLDVDRFDAVCEHLLVRTLESDTGPAEVVGTYRVLTPAAARKAGGFYTEQEFDLRALDDLRPRMIELGRSCTAPEWRRGGVILLLWSALAEFMQRNALDCTIGCASVPMHDGGHGAASLWRSLSASHLVPERRRVAPLLPLPVDRLDDGSDFEVPPLIKGYLKCGGKLLGAPAWDPDFGVADLPMMLDLADLPASYRSRFMGR
jgi:putative hemolysin